MFSVSLRWNSNNGPEYERRKKDLNIILGDDVSDRVAVPNVLAPKKVHWLEIEQENDAHVFVLVGD